MESKFEFCPSKCLLAALFVAIGTVLLITSREPRTSLFWREHSRTEVPYFPAVPRWQHDFLELRKLRYLGFKAPYLELDLEASSITAIRYKSWLWQDDWQEEWDPDSSTKVVQGAYRNGERNGWFKYWSRGGLYLGAVLYEDGSTVAVELAE